MSMWPITGGGEACGGSRLSRKAAVSKLARAAVSPVPTDRGVACWVL